MRWKRGPRSRNIEDRRGLRRSRIRGPAGGLGLGGILLLLILSFVFKQDFFSLLGGGSGSGPMLSSQPVQSSASEEELVDFVSFVLDDAQTMWTQLFATQGATYQDATLVLFRDAVQSACGFARSASGPFYCPGDHKIYVDLGFYEELRTRFGAPGDFAQAYVLAHEIGHHVQRLAGTDGQVRSAQRSRPDLANQLSVAMELQADCYAGVWANTAAQRNLLDPGDVDEGLRAAGSVGDDRIQRMSGRSVNPDAFTHGSSEQRISWFRRGLRSGQVDVCDTF